MAIFHADYSIESNRGAMLTVDFKFRKKMDGTPILFAEGDIVRFKIMEKNKCENVVLQKDVKITEPCESVNVVIPSEEMKIGGIINKPVDYWYELELNPDTPSATTLIGYTKKTGARVFTLTPEGGDKK